MHGLEWFRSGSGGPPERTRPGEFRIYCLLVTLVSIVGQDPFHSFDPVVKNKLQFRGPNRTQKLVDRPEKLIDITEYTTCKRCLDMTETPGVEWCQAGTVWQMRNSNERIFMIII
jgi:hypothetical protein